MTFSETFFIGRAPVGREPLDSLRALASRLPQDIADMLDINGQVEERLWQIADLDGRAAQLRQESAAAVDWATRETCSRRAGQLDAERRALEGEERA